jgi:hypothetical protein
MLDRVHPKIKLLADSLKNAGVKKFIDSKDFERSLMEIGFDDWYYFKEKISHEINRIPHYSSVEDSSFHAFLILLDDLYQTSEKNLGDHNNKFHNFITSILLKIINKSNPLPDFDEIIKDLRILSFPRVAIDIITNTIKEKTSNGVTKPPEDAVKNVNIKYQTFDNIKIDFEQKSKWKNLLADDEPGEVIEQMRILFSDDDRIMGDVINISSRLKRLNKLRHSGTVKFDEIDMEAVKINNALWSLIERLSTR